MEQSEKGPMEIAVFIVRRVVPWIVLLAIVWGIYSMGKTLMSQKPLEETSGLEATPTAAQQKSYAKAKVVNDTLRFRSKPDMTGDVLDTFQKGTVVTIIGKPNGDWLKVRTAKGREGYIFSSKAYVEIIPAKKKK